MVYTYGLVTLIARNVEEASSCVFVEVIVNYIPIIPSMQVCIAILKLFAEIYKRFFFSFLSSSFGLILVESP